MTYLYFIKYPYVFQDTYLLIQDAENKILYVFLVSSFTLVSLI
jgi:hypothetical protein